MPPESYSITAFNDFGQTTVSITVTINPEPVTGITAWIDSLARIHIIFDSLPEVPGYLIYKKNILGDNFVISDTVNAPHTIDSLVEIDSTYRYFIRARTEWGGLSLASDSVSVMVAVDDFKVIAMADTYSVEVGDSLYVPAADGVLRNDEASGTLSAYLVSPAEFGTVQLMSNGAFTYTRGDTIHHQDRFVYSAHQGIFSDSTGVVIYCVIDTSDTPSTSDTTQAQDTTISPVAENDSYGIGEDSVLTVSASQGVLSNDSSILPGLSAVLFRGPSHGRLNLAHDGSFSYSPDSNFAGLDTFMYQAVSSDSVRSANAVTVLYVRPVNDAPVAVSQELILNRGDTIIVTLQGADIDQGDSIVTYTIVCNPAHGTITGSDRVWKYRPDLPFCGNDTLWFTVDDKNATTSAPGEIVLAVACVNTRPSAPKQIFSTVEDSFVVIGKNAIVSNCDDADGDSVYLTRVDIPENGVLVVESSDLRYTPDANFFGTDSFRYVISDGFSAESSLILINVSSVNDPVTITTCDTPSVANLGNFYRAKITASDRDGDSLRFALVQGPAGMRVNKDGEVGWWVDWDTPRSGNRSLVVSVDDGNGSTRTTTWWISIMGHQWTPVSASNSAVCWAAIDSNVVFCSSGSVLRKSINGGVSWTGMDEVALCNSGLINKLIAGPGLLAVNCSSPTDGCLKYRVTSTGISFVDVIKTESILHNVDFNSYGNSVAASIAIPDNIENVYWDNALIYQYSNPSPGCQNPTTLDAMVSISASDSLSYVGTKKAIVQLLSYGPKDTTNLFDDSDNLVLVQTDNNNGDTVYTVSELGNVNMIVYANSFFV